MWLYRATPGYHNGFKPYARVRIRETPGGSNVEVIVTSEELNQFGSTVWFGFFGLLILGSFVRLISHGSWQELYMALFGGAPLGAYLLMFAFGRWLARGDPKRLLGYIGGRLGITDTGGPTAGPPLPGGP